MWARRSGGVFWYYCELAEIEGAAKPRSWGGAKVEKKRIKQGGEHKRGRSRIRRNTLALGIGRPAHHQVILGAKPWGPFSKRGVVTNKNMGEKGGGQKWGRKGIYPSAILQGFHSSLIQGEPAPAWSQASERCCTWGLERG